MISIIRRKTLINVDMNINELTYQINGANSKLPESNRNLDWSSG